MSNNIKFIGLFLVISISLISCEKEDNDISIKGTKWKVVYIKDNGSSFNKRAKEDYIIEFKNDSSYSLSLDVNECIGNYNILNEKEIIIARSGCTKVCCDSEFAEELRELLGEINNYNIDRDILFLLSN